MTLKVSSWVTSAHGGKIPVCQARSIFGERDQTKSYVTLAYKYAIELELCWSYFAQGYQCFCLQPQFDDSLENNVFHIYNFQFSFIELEDFEGQSKVFTGRKRNTCTLYYEHYNCLSDSYGFALLYLSLQDLELYYYDFENKYTTYVKIPFILKFGTAVKLVNRTIWILTYNMTVQGCTSDINAICIKNENEWYHANSASYSTINLTNIESNCMLVDDNVKQPNKLFDWKVLYINTDDLVPNETNKRKFTELQKPNQVKELDLELIGLYKTTLVLTSKISPNSCYFLKYKKMRLTSFQKIDLGGYFEDDNIFPNKREYFQFHPEAERMLVKIDLSKFLMVVINLRTFCVTQILELSVNIDVNFISVYSRERKEIVIMDDDKEPVIHKFTLSHGLTLKEQAMNTIAKYLSSDEIEAINLPPYLVREILLRKMY